MDAVTAILESPQFAGLQKEVVEFASRKVLVLEQCGLTDAQNGRIAMEMKTDAAAHEFIGPAERFGLARLYIDLASVSFGDVPTFLEFTAMRPDDSTAWMNAALRVNPVMFEWLSKISEAIESVETELEKEKKKRRRRG